MSDNMNLWIAFVCIIHMEPHSENRDKAVDWTVIGFNLYLGKRFFLLQNVQTSSGADPAPK